MVDPMKRLTGVLEEKKRIDERAKYLALTVLSEWVEDQLTLCTTDDQTVTRESVQKSEEMSIEIFTSLSTALNMGSEAIASQANTTLRRTASSSGLWLSDLIRFDVYTFSLRGTIKLQYKH